MTTMRLSSVQSSMELCESLYGNRVAPDRNGQAPSNSQIISLIEAAASVPDHGYVQPWRFVVVRDDARDKMAEALAADVASVTDMSAKIEKARNKAYAAPCLIVLVASTKPLNPIPVWEQLASAACTGYAIVLAAHALGLGAIWKSTGMRDGKKLREFCNCSEDEQLLGWVLVGERPEVLRPARKMRPAFDPGALITVIE